MKKLLLLLTLIVGHELYAQVGIGTETPNPSSQLEVISENRGVLIPRIALTSDTDQTTISTGNVESLLVYNTSTNATLTPGYYYWYQGSWQRLTAESDLPDNIVYWDVVNNQFIYVDENGVIQIIDLSDLETLTVLTDNGDGTFTYTDEAGNDVTFDANTTSMTDNGDGTYTFTNANGDEITIDVPADVVNNFNEIVNSGPVTINGTTYNTVEEYLQQFVAGNETLTVLTDNGDGTFTYTDEAGNDVTFDANTTTVTDNGDGTYTIENANGDSVTVDVVGDVVNNFNEVVNGGPVTVNGNVYNTVEEYLQQFVGDNETLTVLTDNGDGTFTYTDEAGNDVIFDANTTSMVDNGDGTYVFTNANGDSINVNTNAPKFFYMPAVIFETVQTGTGLQRNLYDDYLKQFTGQQFDVAHGANGYSRTYTGGLVGSTGAPTSIQVFQSNELYYYVTYYDENVFANLSIDANGILTYDIISNASPTSYMNIVFVIKD